MLISHQISFLRGNSVQVSTILRKEDGVTPLVCVSKIEEEGFPNIWEINDDCGISDDGKDFVFTNHGNLPEDIFRMRVIPRESVYMCIEHNLSMFVEDFLKTYGSSSVVDFLEDEMNRIDFLYNRRFSPSRSRLGSLSDGDALKPIWNKTTGIRSPIFESSEQSVMASGVDWMENTTYSFRGEYYAFNPSLGPMICNGFDRMSNIFVLKDCFNGYASGSRFRIIEMIERAGRKYVRLFDGEKQLTVGADRGDFVKEFQKTT